VKYEKEPFTFEEQADHLIEEGLEADRGALIARLAATNYFRFCAYVHPFRQPDMRCAPGTKMEQVWRLYTFDHRLRMLCLDAIESIEVQVRTQLAYHFAHTYGPFEYLNAAHFPNFDAAMGDFGNWKHRIEKQVERSLDPKGKEDFVVSYFRDYGDQHDKLPVWMMVELLDFGGTLSFFRGVKADIRKTIADPLGQPEEVVLSWLVALNIVRNRCAHHARLWNWGTGSPAKIPTIKKFPRWHQPRLSGSRTGMILFICRHWLHVINPASEWPQRVTDLFSHFPEIPLSQMGLRDDWQEHPVWKKPSV
jgi:abortive infection bacteriophage resistance protein